MGEFRIGRKFAQHSYPDPPRSASSTISLARNFASGPSVGTDIAIGGTQVPWNQIDVGSPGVNVRITPVSTGVVIISGVLTVKNTDADNLTTVSVEVQVGGVSLPIPFAENARIPGNATLAIPFLAEAVGLPTGSPSNVQILVTTPDVNDVAVLVQGSSTIDVSEVQAATG